MAGDEERKDGFVIGNRVYRLTKFEYKANSSKSLIRKLRYAVVAEVVNHKRGRKPKYNDIEKRHLILVWKLTGHPCSKRLVALMDDWLIFIIALRISSAA